MILLVILFTARISAVAAPEKITVTGTEKLENSIKDLLKKAESAPDDYFINVNLGWLYFQAGKYANSLYHYKLATERNTWSLESRMGCHLVAMATMKYPEAEKYARGILEIDPLNFFGNIYLIKALIAQEKKAEAEKIVIYILTFYPSDPQLNALFFQLQAK
jgi:tetratricopeptide (TPR) repeat protein